MDTDDVISAAASSIVRMRMTPTPSLFKGAIRSRGGATSPTAETAEQTAKQHKKATSTAIQLVKFELLRVQRQLDSMHEYLQENGAPSHQQQQNAAALPSATTTPTTITTSATAEHGAAAAVSPTAAESPAAADTISSPHQQPPLSSSSPSSSSSPQLLAAPQLTREDTRAVEQKILSLCSSPSLAKDTEVLPELTVMLWKKIEELQTVSAAVIALKEAQSVKTTVASAAYPSTRASSSSGAAAGKNKLAGGKWPSPTPLFTAEHPRVGEGATGRITEAICESREADTALERQQKKNLLQKRKGGGGGVNGSGAGGGEIGGATGDAGAGEDGESSAHHAEDGSKTIVLKQGQIVVDLPAGQVLVRSRQLRPETVRALSTSCNLDLSTETTLRRASFSSAFREDVAGSAAADTTPAAASADNNNNNSDDATSRRDTPVPSSTSSAVVAVDLDQLFRRACSVIETFSHEVIDCRKQPSIASPSRGGGAAGTVARGGNGGGGGGNSGLSTPLSHHHRMLLPPMMAMMSASQHSTTTNNNNNASGSSPFGTGPSSPHHQHGSGSGSGLSSSAEDHQASLRSERKANEIIERERRQHAIEASELEGMVEELTDKVASLEKELQQLREFYKRKEETTGKDAELALTRDELKELRDTYATVQKVRREESRRSIDIISDLEKTVAQQNDIIALRDQERHRLSSGIRALVELYAEQRKEVAEHQAKAELAAKSLLLYEQTYTHAQFVELCELRERLFESQCQVDEREKSLGLAQQRLRDAKEQLQVAAADDASFIERLKLSDEWRALTLAAADETGEAVRCINELFERRKSSLRQQEDAQAKRFKMLEDRLNEEVYTRRQKNVQNLPAADEADKLKTNLKEQRDAVDASITKKCNATVRVPKNPEALKECTAKVIQKVTQKHDPPIADLKALLVL